MERFAFGLCAVAIAITAWSGSAAAFEGYPGIRPLGMGGASRAYAVGDAGPLLNPSGMSLLKTYTVEGAYAYGRRFRENFFHASIVDNTSMYGIAGGAYYTYHMAEPPGTAGTNTRGHEGGLALSIPFGQFAALGATVKYLRLEGLDALGGERDSGVTFDVGVTLHPAQVLTLGVVGTNLYDVKNGQAPQGVAYGAALIPVQGLIVVADGRTTFTANNYTGRKGTSIMAGGEYTFVQRFSVRAGGGYDATTGNGYLTAGASALSSEVGAIDVGFWQDVSRSQDAAGVPVPRQTVLGVSLRLFVPANETQPQ